MKVGVAPVSFGVYGPPEEGSRLSPDHLVAAMASSGYPGAEFPPAGYAGPPGAAARLFRAHDLDPVGIYIPIHFADPDLMVGDEARMEEALRELEEAGGGSGLAILADEGSETLLLHPARGDDPTHALGPDAFEELCEATNRMAARIRRRGLVPSFHPHISTYVESPAEVERLLELTDIDLTFDTGHIALGGGDTLECLEVWRERINHIHLKDVLHQVLADVKSDLREDFEVWWPDLFTPLGEGDLPLREFLARLSETDYRGWVVVEQDCAPVSSQAELDSAARVQARNLRWVREVEEKLCGEP